MIKGKKKLIIFGSIALGIIQVLIICFIFAYTALLIEDLMAKKVPTPEIKYAEFPFRLVYEKDGKQTVVEDTLVIQYKGKYWGFDMGKGYNWERYLLSEKDLDENKRVSNNQEIVLIEKYHEVDGRYPLVSFVFGSSDYLMGLEDTSWSGVVVDTSILTDEEVFAKYGIKIIEKYMAPPISNQLVNQGTVP